MLNTWLWHYPARKAGIVMIFSAVLGSIHLWMSNAFELGGWQFVCTIALCLAGAGTGCALLAYHAQEGEEDTATKKKIILVGMAVMMPMAALAILGGLRIL